jgi:hypothetical protein
MYLMDIENSNNCKSNQDQATYIDGNSTKLGNNKKIVNLSGK